MKTNHFRQNIFAVLAALIWGVAFVAQSVSADYMGPFTFNAVRSLIAFVVLLIACVLFRKFRREPAEQSPERNPHYYRDLCVGGICCGAALTVATNLQQKGIETTTSGKAGFITALYIVIVPILGIFLKKKTTWTVYIGIAVAVLGLYFLCIQKDFSISSGDFYILLCSFCFSAQILLIDHFAQRVNGIDLSCAQFLVVLILSSIGMVTTESPSLPAIRQCLWPLLYAGVLSSGVAYTLQIMAQKDSNPTVISLLLSLESFFATLAGALILHDHMTGREYLGCALMMAAVILAQIPTPKRSRCNSVAAKEG